MCTVCCNVPVSPTGCNGDCLLHVYKLPVERWVTHVPFSVRSSFVAGGDGSEGDSGDGSVEGQGGYDGGSGLDPDERPAKLLCQGDGSGSQRAVVVDLVVGDAGAGSSSGAKESGCPPAFTNVSLDVGPVFDCSGLSGALESDLLVASEVAEISDEEAPADMFVPGAARPVVISKQLIVKEIAHRLHLKIHDFGTIDEAHGLVRGWIEMDVPRRLADEPKTKEKFVGADALGRYAAMENVSEDVIKELCRGSGSHYQGRQLP